MSALIMGEGPCRPWILTYSRLDDSYSSDYLSLVKIFSESNRPELNKIFNGEDYETTINTKDISINLTKQFGSDIERSSRYLYIFKEVIICGNEIGQWNLELPYLPVISQREMGRFTPDRFSLNHFYSDWKGYLDASILNETKLDEEGRLGQFILSVVLYGGVLSVQLLSALLSACHKLPAVFNGRGYVDLSVTWHGIEESESRRLFLDAISELLIYKLNIKEKNLFGKNNNQVTSLIFGYVTKFFSQVGCEKQLIPPNITMLLNTCSLRYELMLCPVVTNYLKRKHPSHSVGSRCWSRIEGRYSEVDSEYISNNIDIRFKPSLDERNIKTESITFNNLSFKKILEIPDYKDRPEIKIGLKQLIDRNNSHPHGLVSLLLKWASSDLINGKGGVKAASSTTIKRYIYSIGTRLYEQIGIKRFIDLSSSEIEDAYIQLLESIESRNLRNKISRLLNRFHKFIVKNHGVSEIDYKDVLADSYIPTPVDANIILVDEFNRMLKILDDSDLSLKSTKLPIAAKILAILGYKCGLRRSEALKLRVKDISGNYNPMLLVRPHYDRRLKTLSSKRILPLKVFLEESELDLFRSWLKQRKNEEEIFKYSKYLFSIPELGYLYIPEEYVFPIIHQALRLTAGDNTLRYHHFRHSFGSMTLLRLMVSDHGIPEGIFDNQPDTLKWLKNSMKFRTELYKKNLVTRRHLYFVSQLLGHSSPDISLEHYIHTMDIISAHVIKKRFPPDIKVLVAASGLSQSTAYRLSKINPNNIVSKVREKNGYREGKLIVHNNTTIISSTPIDSGQRKANDAWKALFLYSERKVDLESLCERFLYTKNDLSRLIANSENIQKIKSNDRLKSPKIKMMKSEDGMRILPCPPKPRLHKDLVVADVLSDALYELKKANIKSYEDLMNLYVNGSWTTRYLVVFKTISESNYFIELMSKLKLPKEWLQYSVLVGQGMSEKSIKYSVNNWRQTLKGVNNKLIHPKASTDGVSVGKHGYLGINLVDPISNKSFSASRYSFAMSLIINGYDCNPTII